jgi:hypothetical protein
MLASFNVKMSLKNVFTLLLLSEIANLKVILLNGTYFILTIRFILYIVHPSTGTQISVGSFNKSIVFFLKMAFFNGKGILDSVLNLLL